MNGNKGNELEALLEAMKEFESAACTISRLLEQSDYLNNASCDSYPFAESFDQVQSDIIMWRHSIQEKLKKAGVRS